MPRGTSIHRAGNKVVVVIEHISHTLSEPAFIELMQHAVRVMASLEREREAS